MKHKRLLVTICTAAVMTIGVTTMASAQARPRTRVAVQAHTQFDDHDRQVTSTWYDSHRTSLPRGLRDNDRFPPDVEGRIAAGFVLEAPMRRQVYAVPSALLRQLGPAPRGDRYVMVGGHILLIDRGYRVIDVIHVGHGR
jgi:Ni/Co efflux regulator RcnB